MFSVCVRRVRKDRFDDEPVIGPTSYLHVPDGTDPRPEHRIPRTEWLRRLLATFNPGPGGVGLYGDLTVYVHGYNNSIATVAARHRALQNGLSEAGFSTTIVSFDWPSGTMPIGYLEDRHDAMITAMRLVTDGIRVMLGVRRPDCEVNIHIVAHSMGAFVLREAFEDADNSRAADQNWTANQVVLVAGDISAGSLTAGNPMSDSLFRHAGRVTNYYNRHDAALQVSNVKRLGLSPRVGRVGMPVSATGVDVDCSVRFQQLQGEGKFGDANNASHTFYFGDEVFYADLAATLLGRVDRAALPTRGEVTGDGPNSYWLHPA